MIRKSLTAMILFAGLTSGLVSCKKDKDENPGGSNPPAHIKEYRDGDDFVRFRYNAAGRVDQVTINSDINTGGVPTVYAVSYTQDNKIEKLVSASDEIHAVYENGKLTRSEIFVEEEKLGFTNYSYEANQLKRATIYTGQGEDFNPLMEFIFTTNNAGNITETVVMMNAGEPGDLDRSGHVNFQYDQKPNPLYEHRDLLALFWQSVSKNNIVQEDHFDENLEAEDKFVYAFTYNAQGYPSTAVVTQGLPGQPAVTSQLLFSYQ